MIVCIPEGNAKKDNAGNYEDKSRAPEIYESTYQYLKSLGIEEIWERLTVIGDGKQDGPGME